MEAALAALTDKQFAQQLRLQLAELHLQIAALSAVSEKTKERELFINLCRRVVAIGDVLATLRFEE